MNLKMGLSNAEIGDLSLLVKSDLLLVVAEQPTMLLSSPGEYDPVSGRNGGRVPTPGRAANIHNHDQPSRSNKHSKKLFRTVP